MLITLQKQVLEVGHVCDVAFNRDRFTAGCFAIADDVSGALAIRHVDYTDVVSRRGSQPRGLGADTAAGASYYGYFGHSANLACGSDRRPCSR